ncbi:MAG: cohesin domain-containing protein [Desulfococcaceae bacterium]
MKKFNLGMTIFAMAFCFFCHNALAADLEMQSTAAQAEKEMTLTFSISNAPNAVYSFGFDLSYDATLMEYKSYSFAGSLVQQFEFLHVNPFSAGKIRVGGMDAGSNIIAQNASGSLVTLTFTVLKPGSAQISIQNQTDDIAAWSAANAQILSKDAYEPDNLHPLAGVIDKVQRHNFHEAGDADWGMVYGTAGKSYTVKTGNAEANCDTVIELYGIDGQTLIMSKNDNGAGTGDSLAWSCTQDTIYFVKITHSNPNVFGDGTAYDLWVEYPPEFDAYESDDTADKAKKIIVDFRPQRHSFLTQNDEDWVKFETVPAQLYTIEVKNHGDNTDIIIELYAMGNSQTRKSGRSDPAVSLLKTENSNGIGEDETMIWESPLEGTIYVKVTNSKDSYGEGTDYDLRVARTGAKLPGTVFGVVKSALSDMPLEDVRVEIRCDPPDTCDFNYLYDKTNAYGCYNLSFSGDHILTALKEGHHPSLFIEVIDKDTQKTTKAAELPVLVKYDNQSFNINIKMAQCLGDTNGDQEITAADALIAFDSYLQRNPTTYGFDPDMVCCDVNRDGTCTPADALCIFQKFMKRPCCLD